jgi:hypothetical protein
LSWSENQLELALEAVLEEINKILWKHASDGLYFGAQIPEKKLQNALKAIPVKGDVLALLDCTVFGSCKNGVAITTEGVYWSNDWTVDSSIFGMSWDEIADSPTPPFYKSAEIVLRPGAHIGVAACSFNKKQLVAFFKDIAELSHDLKHSPGEQADEPPQIMENSQPSALAKGQSLPAEQGQYDEVTAYILALVTIADGVVDDDEITFAHEFINEEDGVSNKNESIKTYDEVVKSLSEAKEKSNALFKIRANKLISEIAKVEDEEFFNRVTIMLEGMVEAAGGFNNFETVRMVEKILARESFVSGDHPPNMSEAPASNEGSHISLAMAIGLKEETSEASANELALSAQTISASIENAGNHPLPITDVELEEETDQGTEKELALSVRAKSVSAEDSAAEPAGLKKYWPRIEKFVIGNMMELADDKLQKPEELTLYFSKLYELLPVAVRLVMSQEKFVNLLMSRREPLIAKVQDYKLAKRLEAG